MDCSILKPCGVAAAAALLCAGALAAEPLPISLDAESSTFDRQTNTVEFRRLSITQGDMVIRADEAVATGLDFDMGEWRFSGNVELTVGASRIEADSATLLFADNQLQTAELVGAPATFERAGTDYAGPITGGASRFAYDNVARVMHMLGSASFRQGQNEFRGCDLVYDLDEEQITSGSSDCGEPVVITIVPPSSEDGGAGPGAP